MIFNKIACADNPGLPDWAYKQIQTYSNSDLLYTDRYPDNDEEIIRNIGKADCALVSWNTAISKQVIEACPNLRYIGMCCSLIDENSASVDIAAAKQKGIVVKGVRDYGDEGVIEYIFSELISLLKGLGPHQWKKDQVELGNQKIGIIGMGTTGRMLTKAALFFNMQVFYFSRTRAYDMEEKGCTYLPLNSLVENVDILSIHLPRNTELLTADHFRLFGYGKILINTTLGLSFNLPSFIEWIQVAGNYAIMDASGMGVNLVALSALPRMLSTPITSGFTHEAKDRLAQKVILNIQSFLGND